MEVVTQCLACRATQFHSVQRTAAMMHPSQETFNFDQCDNCGLVFLNPRVPVGDLMEYYQDYYLPYRGERAWGRYASLVAGSQVKMDKQRLAFVAAQLPLTAESVVLDVGCGKPTFLEQLQQRYNCRAVGYDFSDEGWREDAARYQKLELHTGDLNLLTQKIKPNVLTMWHYLEHDYEPLKTLESLRAMVPSGTKLIIEVPNFDSDSRRKFGAHWAAWHTPRHTALYTPATMTTLLENSGWQVEKTLAYGTLDPYNLYWMSKMEQRGIDWSKSMESEFVGYVLGMLRFLPDKLREKQKSLGVMTAVATTL